jgi:tRNA G18 (ribose-2'-O)-methylase SpoU
MSNISYNSENSKLKGSQIRKMPIEEIKISSKRNPLIIIADNILDTFNIGGLFRLADAVFAEMLIICGNSEVPPNTKITKASCGTYKIVPWRKAESAAYAIDYLKHYRDIKVVAVELSEKSVDYNQLQFDGPTAIVVGNETTGVSEEALSLCDAFVSIPMYGVNISLNVGVAAALVAYKVVESMR